jgi:hypothetical protein
MVVLFADQLEMLESKSKVSAEPPFIVGASNSSATRPLRYQAPFSRQIANRRRQHSVSLTSSGHGNKHLDERGGFQLPERDRLPFPAGGMPRSPRDAGFAPRLLDDPQILVGPLLIVARRTSEKPPFDSWPPLGLALTRLAHRGALRPHLPPFWRLQRTQSIWQLAESVLPPLDHGVT